MTIQERAYSNFTSPFPAGLQLPLVPLAPIDQPPAIFIDRDGVINQNRKEHVLSWDQFEFINGSKRALALLNTAGYRVIIITNQAQIDRGLLKAAQLDELHQRMIDEIEAAGGRVAAVYYCPHRPEANCYCRKPKPGLLLNAAEKLHLDLDSSWFIGDHLTDVEAGLAAGCKPLLVLTGRGEIAAAQWKLSQEVENSGAAWPALTATSTSLATKAAAATGFQLPIKADLLEAVEFVLAADQSKLV